MPFSRPDLKTLIDRAADEMNARLPGADARLRASNLNVLAHVLAGGVHGLYGYLDWLSRQVIYDTAEAEFLERWAGIWGMVRTPAVSAIGTLGFTGSDGAAIPKGARLTRADGVEFEVSEGGFIEGGAASLPVRAAVAGDAGNTPGGVKFTLVSPVPGVASEAVLDADGAEGGADSETDAALRARFLKRLAEPPMGGAKTDYEQWALAFPGVTRAWVFPLYLGIGTVAVFFVRDNDDNLIPGADEVAALQAWIDERRPVTADVSVIAPIAAPVDFSLSITPDTPATRSGVEYALRDLLEREAAPLARIPLSHINEAISGASGEFDHTLTAPASDIIPGAGELPVFGSIAWG